MDRDRTGNRIDIQAMIDAIRPEDNLNIDWEFINAPAVGKEILPPYEPEDGKNPTA
jgi:hypothetical protein